ncbi:hypothetical protein HETIRDRAFT_106896 [Heterobasidion irregulare TC 32-1]|uniref:Uncharacterized protein n=1 Tax=Heterobasidion irregulare (strain TC 32-1) TaxID=747525 RepID=W4KBV9_HETIT|nr:uncharacterized protein HETIRDRAFT_106896 [Heterobasidion irregulare TC 32-1]ETW83347.1 hypothetical protein HETIRDRAFT_106896 [Heterobasidion irregulare TC 32-1]
MTRADLPSCPSAELGQQPDPPSLRPDSRPNATARPFTARVARGVSAGPSQRGPESARPPAPPANTHNLSSSTALDSITEEAALMMISAVREDGSIPCGRQGCYDILKDVKRWRYQVRPLPTAFHISLSYTHF